MAGGEAPRTAAGGAQRRLGGAAARGREARAGQTPAGERGAQERAREGQTRTARQTEPYPTHSRARAGQTRTAQRASTEPPSGGQTRTAERTRAAATPSRPPSNHGFIAFLFGREKRGADFSTPHRSHHQQADVFSRPKPNRARVAPQRCPILGRVKSCYSETSGFSFGFPSKFSCIVLYWLSVKDHRSSACVM